MPGTECLPSMYFLVKISQNYSSVSSVSVVLFSSFVFLILVK